jgi:hypothetical protein
MESREKSENKSWAKNCESIIAEELTVVEHIQSLK